MNIYEIFEKSERIHFVGIGGICMSALAKYCVGVGKMVSGSDRKRSEITEELKKLGVKVNYGHAYKNVVGASMVVYTSAINDKNPEMQYAVERKIPLIKRSELLGYIMGKYLVSIAVSGSHGKTTATSMISEIFIKANKNPTVFLGGENKEFGNFRKGGGQVVIAEACEYKKNFLDLSPFLSVILNIDNDHLDSFKVIKDEVSAFSEFSKSSISVINADDKNCIEVFNSKTVTFGIENSGTYTAKRIKKGEKGYSFTIYKYGKRVGRINLSIEGKHNVYNALSAFGVADIFKIPFSIYKKAIEGFNGVKRRNEYLGKYDKKKVFADYAHHPTEIKALLKAYKERGEKTLSIFQPHTYSRTKYLMQDFIYALSTADKLIILKTYPAREKYDVNGDAKTLYKNLKKTYGKFLEYSDEKNLNQKIKKGETGVKNILFIGAGDIYESAKALIKEKKVLSKYKKYDKIKK